MRAEPLPTGRAPVGPAARRALAALASAVILTSTACATQPSPSASPGGSVPGRPPGFTLALPSPCGGVRVRPGDDVQRVVDGRPHATTLCFAAGTYHLSSAIVPKTGDRLLGGPGVVLTGDDRAAQAIAGFSTAQTHVSIMGFVVEHFLGASSGSARGSIKTGYSWTVARTELRFNRFGLDANSGDRVRDNYIHDNAQAGIIGGPMSDVLFERNVVDHNNVGNYSWEDAGGTKIIESTNVTFRHNVFDGNVGNAVWCDADCRFVTFDSNTLSDNQGSGIIYEISFDGTISNNVLTNDGTRGAGRSCLYGGAIVVSNSSNLVVNGNTIHRTDDRGSNGICVVDVNRGTSPRYGGAYRAANVTVQNNVVRLRSGATAGFVTSIAPGALGSRFSANTYIVDQPGGLYFAWSGSPVGWVTWRALGQDRGGRLTLEASSPS